MKSKPCSWFLAYNFGKNLCENDVLKGVCFVSFFRLCSARYRSTLCCLQICKEP